MSNASDPNLSSAEVLAPRVEEEEYAVEVKDLSFAYLGTEEPAIVVDHFAVKPGESVLIVGKSGEGKSTFVNSINGVIPHIFKGKYSGTVKVFGTVVSETPISKLCTKVGTLLQDPESQILNYTVEEEVAFGPENLAMPPDEIRRRIEEAIRQTGIEYIRDRETYVLSGGELQRVALAAVLAMETPLLILDEPTSNIDPATTNSIFDILRSLKRRKTLIIVEHKVERVLPFVDRIVLIRKGRIKFDIPKEKLQDYIDDLKEAGVEVPPQFQYAKMLGLPTADIEVIRKKLKEMNYRFERPERFKPSRIIMESRSKVWVEDKIRGRLDILDVEVNLGEGEILAIMGQNGAGKSTYLKSIVGFLDKTLLKTDVKLVVDGVDLSRATIQERGRYITFVPQTFELTIITTSVQNEVAYSLRKHGVKNWKQRLEELLEMFSLKEFREKDPLTLSMGQMRRVAMASALGSGAKVIMLDEPTSGQDFYHKEVLGNELRKLQKLGYSFVIVTHDSRFVYYYADRVVVFNRGRKVLDGPPEDVFRYSEEYGIPPPTDYVLSE